MKIIYALYRNRNGRKYVHSNEDFCEKSSSQAMWRFPWELLYALNIQQGRFILRFIKAVIKNFWGRYEVSSAT